MGREKGLPEVKKDQVAFPCGKLKLEGIYYGAGAGVPSPAVVVCHPHPLYGGSMHNNVTYAIASALAAAKINALLFNFRGVGSSGGSYGGGIEETKDVEAALDWLQERKDVDQDKIGLAGYSFGAGVAFHVACSDGRVRAAALISPYFEYDPDDMLKSCIKPKLILGGSEDQVVPQDRLLEYGREACLPKQVEIVQGPDHFWGGYENAMSGIVADFFSGVFSVSQGI